MTRKCVDEPEMWNILVMDAEKWILRKRLADKDYGQEELLQGIGHWNLEAPEYGYAPLTAEEIDTITAKGLEAANYRQDTDVNWETWCYQGIEKEIP